MVRNLTVLLLILLLSSCGKSPLSLLTGGGPNVAANTQIGKTNTQTVGTTTNVAPTVSVRPQGRIDSVDQSTKTTTVNEIQPWILILLVLGWLLPSPQEIFRSIASLTKRRK
jgi:hypothetical protein